MLDENSGELRTVAWSEICPWLVIFRTFRLAVSLRVLLPAAVAILLTAGVWSVFGAMFASNSEATQWTQPFVNSAWMATTEVVPEYEHPQLPDAAAVNLIPVTDNPVLAAWSQLMHPLWGVFQPDATAWDLICLLLCGLASLAIWAFFGGAITRIAAVQLAGGEQISLPAALRFACSKWPAFFIAPLVPLLGVAFAALPVWIIGLLLNANLGVLLAAIIWPILLIIGAAMTLLLLGLIFGWPLMWATISTEGTDSFDALSRSYAYVFQRPLHYLFYAIVAALLGILSWLLVSNFAAAVISLTYWAASFGCGADRIDNIATGSESLGSIGHAGAALIAFWTGCVKLLAAGFIYSYFWTAVAAIYLLLRRDADATEMDEVYLDEDADEQGYGLPPLGSDEAGAPVVDDTPTQPPAETQGADVEDADVEDAELDDDQLDDDMRDPSAQR